jgi:LacI family transcriptional regulator
MKNIVLMINTARETGRQFLRGIQKYISTHGRWEISIQPPEYLRTNKFDPESWLQLHKANGIIVRDSPHTQKILELKIPKVICDSQQEKFPGASAVYTNSRLITEIASEYFIGLGFENYAFCGFSKLSWSIKRYEIFNKIIIDNGYQGAHNYNEWLGDTNEAETESWMISKWLQTLPKPVCVYACNDDRALYILEACKIANFKVPDEVAVLGVDNDKLVCELTSPPLSSIELSFEQSGFEAAKLLDKMIRYKHKPQDIIVEPVDVITRQSTNIMAINDQEVTKALIFIMENYRSSIQISDIVKATTASRRSLEMRFKKILKRTIMEEITRLRINSIKKRLRNTHESVYQIAQSLEFTIPEHLSRYFKNATGLSPTAYRQRIGI